jgi:Flp pilus assembly pilin Flp
MKKRMALLRNIWSDESAQGATEYILLLVVVVALAFMFKDKITGVLKSKLEELGASIGSFTGNGQ